MSPERTRQLHRAVSDLLDGIRSGDEELPESMPELERLHAELGDLLAEQAPPTETLGAQLRAALDRFEARHPRTTMMVGRIADALSEMGL